MDKYTIAPPAGSTNNSVGASDRPWHEGHFDSVKLNGGELGEYLAESTGYGIVSGCEPSISGLTVTVAAGIVHLADGTRKEIASTNITLDNADSTNPRVDLVYIDSTGVVAKITGTAAASPSAPSVPSGGISVAQVSVAAGATAGTIADMRDMLPRYYNTGIVNVRDFGAVGDGVHDDTEAIQAALNESMLKKVKLIIPSGTYLITTSLIINKAVFIEGWGNAVLNTANDIPIIKFYGTTSDEYALKDSIFRNVKFDGPGTTYGANASGYGIKLGEETDTNTLYNIPMVRIENCSFTGFNKGVYLEGYGHTLKDNYFADCLIGLEIIHPEQVYGINNWIQYCDLGLAVNNAKLQYGHEFIWYGGAIQRNKKGALIYNFYDIYMNIYCEQNSDYDVTFGKSGGDYNYGCKNIHLNLTTTQMSNPTSNSYHVGLFASVSAKVEVANWNTTEQDLTTIKADGYSKFIDIFVPTDTETYTTPYDITGDCRNTTFIHKNNKTYIYNNDLVTENVYKYWSNQARLIEKTGDGGKIISIPKGNYSLFAVLDASNDTAIFQVANNPSAAYFAVTANAKMKMKAGATITLNNVEYNITTDDGQTIKLVAVT